MSDAFITTSDLSSYLGRSVTADAGGTIAVDAACELVRTMTGQTFNAGTSTIHLDGTGTDALPLPEFPVNTVGTVAVGGTITSGSIAGGSAVTNWALRGDGVLLRTAGAAVADYTEDVLPLRWPKGRQNIQVTYTHGYSTVPADIRMVALHIASRLIVQGVAQYETVGDVSMRYGTNATDFTAGERIIFSKYRTNR
jgi:hypothetical protein